LTERREYLVASLLPLMGESYELLAGRPSKLEARYQRSWSQDSLAGALAAGREDDVRRGVSRYGPHRDELFIGLDGLASRTEASQGEQRTLALALRLAGHRLVSNRLGEAPLLLLDDVLSELDPDRAAALLANLPEGQSIITTASGLPPSAGRWRAANQLLAFGPGGLPVPVPAPAPAPAP
jgi:DNA replication and repair protein RecF